MSAAAQRRDGRRNPEPTRIDAATRVHIAGSLRWSTLVEGDKRPHDGWLVWGEGTFAGAERIDDAVKAWRDAVRAGWR